MAEAVLCAKCKGRIIGHINKYGGKLYCDHCYEAIIEQLQRLEEEKNKLYSFIKELFSLREIPDPVVHSINKAIDDGKKPSGIRGTLIYYYKVKENPVEDIAYLSLIIQKEYSNAANYFAETKKIKEENALIDINVPTVTVRISTKEKDKSIKYKMEDI